MFKQATEESSLIGTHSNKQAPAALLTSILKSHMFHMLMLWQVKTAREWSLHYHTSLQVGLSYRDEPIVGIPGAGEGIAGWSIYNSYL